MNYVTNYYKNLSEQLQEKVNVLNYKLKLLTEGEGWEEAENTVEPPPSSPRIPPLLNDNKPVTVTPQGTPHDESQPLPDGWQGPHRGGSGPKWKQWVRQNGHWHTSNPYPFGTPAWYQWEWSWYEVVGNGGATPGLDKTSDKIRQTLPRALPRVSGSNIQWHELAQMTRDQEEGLERFKHIDPSSRDDSNPEWVAFKKWLLERGGRWHTQNPNPYGSDHFYIWEHNQWYRQW